MDKKQFNECQNLEEDSLVRSLARYKQLLTNQDQVIIQKFGNINGVDNVNWPPYTDSES